MPKWPSPKNWFAVPVKRPIVNFSDIVLASIKIASGVAGSQDVECFRDEFQELLQIVRSYKHYVEVELTKVLDEISYSCSGVKCRIIMKTSLCTRENDTGNLAGSNWNG